MPAADNTSSLYDVLFTDLADPRTNDWFLLSSPVPGLAILSSYLLFVKVLGPNYMSRRPPVHMTQALVVYNLLQVLLSVFLVHQALGTFSNEAVSFGCQPFTLDRTEEAMKEARCIYFYFLAKITELLDTIFFVLRKKTNHVTFLHVYHHTILPISAWCIAKYTPGGQAVRTAFLNSIVHCIMYLYYMLAACGPQFQKYLWWKKYITILQMVQFGLVIANNILLQYKNCNHTKFVSLNEYFNSFLFLYLFYTFYRRAYKGEKKKWMSRDVEKSHLN